MINILYVPQFSMNDGATAFIDKDGNFIVLTTIIKLLNTYIQQKKIKKERVETIKISILLPDFTKIEETEFYETIEKLTVGTDILVNYKYNNLLLSPIENRYHFNAKLLKQLLAYDNYSAIFNNIPELTRNFRAILGNNKIPIVNLHHFCDYIQENKLVSNWKNGNLFSYFWRQLDGFLSADYNIFNCQESLHGWYQAMGYAVNLDLIPKSFRSPEFSFPITWTDLSDYGLKDNQLFFDEKQKYFSKTAIFPSRITESLYTNWTKVVDLFMDDAIDSKVIITNPSGKKGLKVFNDYIRNFHKTSLDYWALSSIETGNEEVNTVKGFLSPNKKIHIISEDLSREDYMRIAEKSHYVINLYENERYGGIAVRECIGLGKLLPVVPNIHSFSNWLGHFNTDLLFEKVEDLTVEKYNKFIQYYASAHHRILLNKFYKYDHYESYYPSFEKMMEDVTQWGK